MKTKNRKLEFSKSSVVELSDSQTISVNGGCQWTDSTEPTTNTIKITTFTKDNTIIVKPTTDATELTF